MCYKIEKSAMGREKGKRKYKCQCVGYNFQVGGDVNPKLTHCEKLIIQRKISSKILSCNGIFVFVYDSNKC